MWFWLIGAFVFGILTPFMARRFAKFMPATFAGAIVELLRPEKKSPHYRKTSLYKKLLRRALMFGLINSATTAAIISIFPSTGFIIIYVWFLLLLAEIDIKMFLLPDILTIPLLLLGLLAALLGKGILTPDESISGCFIGYFFPAIISLLIVWYKKDAFGGGDIKLLSALGAWIGIEGLLYTITLASILGLLWALISRQKSLAFGPMLAIAGILIMIYIGY